MSLLSRETSKTGAAQCGAHMAAAEARACQNTFLRTFLLFVDPRPHSLPPSFFFSLNGRESRARVTQTSCLRLRRLAASGLDPRGPLGRGPRAEAPGRFWRLPAKARFPAGEHTGAQRADLSRSPSCKTQDGFLPSAILHCNCRDGTYQSLYRV